MQAATIDANATTQPVRHRPGSEGYVTSQERLGPPIQEQWRERIAWDAFSYYPVLSLVEKYVKEHLHDPDAITMREVARLTHYDYRYFSTYFKDKVGIGFSEWLRLLHVDRAAFLLSHRRVGIERAAQDAGFGSVRTCERAFKRFCGLTPAKFRALSRPRPISTSE